MEEILILGVVIRKGQVQMEQDKIKLVKKWKTPMKIQKSRKLSGIYKFYRRFIQNFSHTARPLNKLKDKKEWAWLEEH